VTGPTPRRESVPDPHERFDELAVGHALSALEPQEEALFAAHLGSCARCERAVAEHAATLAELAHAAPPVEPPASVLEGIRDAVRAESRDSLSVVPAQPASRAAAPVADLRERRRRRSVQVRRSHLLTSAAAVVALLLGLGGWNAALQRDNAEQGARVENLAAAVQALENEDTRTVRMSSPEGEVLAVAVVQPEQMSLVVDGLAPNDDDTVYVLWGQSRYGDVRAVSTFDVESRELEVLNGLRLEPGVGEVTTLMVTQEQGRTAPAITTQPVLVSGAVQAT
jgi:anti-sigma factor RsiW